VCAYGLSEVVSVVPSKQVLWMLIIEPLRQDDETEITCQMNCDDVVLNRHGLSCPYMYVYVYICVYMCASFVLQTSSTLPCPFGSDGGATSLFSLGEKKENVEIARKLE
jgi:hypothetical protein